MNGIEIQDDVVVEGIIAGDGLNRGNFSGENLLAFIVTFESVPLPVSWVASVTQT